MLCVSISGSRYAKVWACNVLKGPSYCPDTVALKEIVCREDNQFKQVGPGTARNPADVAGLSVGTAIDHSLATANLHLHLEPLACLRLQSCIRLSIANRPGWQ